MESYLPQLNGEPSVQHAAAGERVYLEQLKPGILGEQDLQGVQQILATHQ
ncbi:MAG: hypothetical protein LBJ70_04945 [Holosporales bacterium]|nr:hypothetical protein [Holosporales bacterium]